MTGRTHDLAALTALDIVVATYALPHMSLATGLCAISACAIGGLAPDMDQPTAALWRRLPAGSIWGKLLAPLFGGHRFISHSILGVTLMGVISWLMLQAAHSVVLVDMKIVWYAFMIGVGSHLIMDTITHEGVPWLFPIPYKFGFPPIRFLRVKSGGFIEKFVIFPGLLIANAVLISRHYHLYVSILKKLIHA